MGEGKTGDLAQGRAAGAGELVPFRLPTLLMLCVLGVSVVSSAGAVHGAGAASVSVVPSVVSSGVTSEIVV